MKLTFECVPREFVDGPLHGQTHILPKDQQMQRAAQCKTEGPILMEDGPPPIFVTYYLLRDDGKFHWHRVGEVTGLLWQCPSCGGRMEGDGYTQVRHCENVDPPEDAEPDANPIYCEVE